VPSLSPAAATSPTPPANGKYFVLINRRVLQNYDVVSYARGVIKYDRAHGIDVTDDGFAVVCGWRTYRYTERRPLPNGQILVWHLLLVEGGANVGDAGFGFRATNDEHDADTAELLPIC
jgi:hypothetical protein